MDFLSALWSILVELSVWLFVGAFVSIFMHKYLPSNFIQGKLQGYGGVLRSVVLGVPLPLCSCGVIPAGISLKKDGASSGSAIGFLISTPQTGVDSILVSSAFLGWPFAIFKVFAAVLMGVVGGALVEALDDKETRDQNVKKEVTTVPSWQDSIEHGVQLIRGIWKWLILGIFLSAALDVWVPDETLMMLGSGVAASFAALLISVPLYVCATASVPIAASLVAGGFPPAAALVFLVAGPATNVATIGSIFSAFGKRTTIIYVATVVIGSLILGSLFSFVVPEVTLTSHHDYDVWWMEFFAVTLVLSLVYFAYEEILQKLQAKKMQKKLQVQSSEDVSNKGKKHIDSSVASNSPDHVFSLQLQGLDCGSCVSKITKKLNNHFTMEHLSIDLESEKLYFTGNINIVEVKQHIRELGFGVYDVKTLSIDGLHCGSCVSKLTKSFHDVEGVKTVFISLEKHTATVESILSEQQLEDVVQQAGFSLQQTS